MRARIESAKGSACMSVRSPTTSMSSPQVDRQQPTDRRESRPKAPPDVELQPSASAASDEASVTREALRDPYPPTPSYAGIDTPPNSGLLPASYPASERYPIDSGAGLGELKDHAHDMLVDDVFVEMELRKMSRRYKGYRHQSQLMTPLFNVILIVLIPFLIFDCHVSKTFECRDRFGRTYPCSFANNFTCRDGENGTDTAVVFFDDSGNEFNVDGNNLRYFFSTKWESMLYIIFWVLVAAMLLYYTGGAWIFRWYIYSVAWLECTIRLVQGLCQLPWVEECPLGLRNYGERTYQIFAVMSLLLVLLISSFYLQTVLPFAARHRWLRFRNVRHFYRMKPLSSDQFGCAAASLERAWRLTWRLDGLLILSDAF